MTSFWMRLVGALRLNRATFEEIAVSRSATPQALVLLALMACAGALSSPSTDGAVPLGVIIGATALTVLVGLTMEILLVYFVGIRLSGGSEEAPGVLTLSETEPIEAPKAGLTEIFRVLAFVRAPILLLLVVALPGIGAIPGLVATVGVGVALWQFFVWFAGLAALGISTRRALGIFMIAYVIAAVPSLFL